MKRLLLVALATGLVASSGAHASAELAKQRNCMTCHAVSNKIIGPSFKDVAAKYAGQKGAEEKLAQKILKGSSGVWGGPAVMPANAQVSEAEAKTLVKWIMSQK
jgi:cytochrome c